MLGERGSDLQQKMESVDGVDNQEGLLENAIHSGKTMTSILYQMKSSFVGGLHFIDGKPPIFEILPWSISRHIDPSRCQSLK